LEELFSFSQPTVNLPEGKINGKSQEAESFDPLEEDELSEADDLDEIESDFELENFSDQEGSFREPMLSEARVHRNFQLLQDQEDELGLSERTDEEGLPPGIGLFYVNEEESDCFSNFILTEQNSAPLSDELFPFNLNLLEPKIENKDPSGKGIIKLDQWILDWCCCSTKNSHKKSLTLTNLTQSSQKISLEIEHNQGLED